MLVDILAESILTGSNIGFFVGIPRKGGDAIGDVNGTNKRFTVANPPIFPVSCNDITVKKDDITVYVDGEAVPVSSIIEDEEGYPVGFELQSAPEIGDKVTVDYYEQLEPFIATKIEPSLDQDTKEVNPINQDTKITAYGTIKTELKATVVMTENGLEQFKALMFYDDTPAGVTDRKVYRMYQTPQNLYAYTQFRMQDEIMARMYFENVRVKPSIPGGEGGEQLEAELEMTVAGTPILVEPVSSP